MSDRLAEMERRGAPSLRQAEAGAFTDWLSGNGKPNKYWSEVGRGVSYDWCRFRRDHHCWLPKDLNEAASKQAGYAVWNPVDRGYCPRVKWESQQICPTGAPGPNVAGGFTDATIPWEQGGQRGGVPSGMYRASLQTTAEVTANKVSRVLGAKHKRAEKVTGRVRGYHTWMRGFRVTSPSYDVVHVEYEPGKNGEWSEETVDAYLHTLTEAGLYAVKEPFSYGAHQRSRIVVTTPKTSSLQTEAAPLFQDSGYSDEEMKEFAERWKNVAPHIFERDNAYIALVHGVPVGQLTWTLERDERAFSDDDDIADQAMGDYNGYYAKIDVLAVDRAFRRRGIAKALMDKFVADMDRRFGFLGEPGERRGWDPGSFTEAGSKFWKAYTGESVPVTQRTTYSSRTAAFEVTASWADIRAKAKRIREGGGVRVVAADGGTVVGHIKGDHGVYETELVRNPGQKNVAYWHCGCKWGAYSWGRSGPWKRYEGRMCSHALALQYETQSRNFGDRTMTLDEKQPAWMDQKHVHRPGDYDRSQQKYTHRVGHAVSAAFDPHDDGADVAPVVLFARAAMDAGMRYVDVRDRLIAQGVENPVEIVRTARGTTTFRARVRGLIREILLDDDGPKVEGREKVPAREVLYPGWHPTKGMNINDRGKVGSLHTASSVEDFLRMLQKARGTLPQGVKYSGVDGLILHFGKRYTRISRELPEGLERGEKKQCYSNAFNAAMNNPDLTYVEGYASAIIPTMHAWVVDSSGTVYDPTWDAGQGKEYFGVAFDTGWLRQHILSKGYYGVFADDMPGPEMIDMLRNGIPANALSRTSAVNGPQNFEAAAKAMIEMARRNEPDTTLMVSTLALKHGGEMVGLDHRLKTKESLLRKMQDRAEEHGGDANRTAANISDSLRYTMMFSTGRYTAGVKAVLGDLDTAGYRIRTKNYWEKGDPYDGINVALMTPKGHPFELQFHTPESMKAKDLTHRLYEGWRTSPDPEVRRELAEEMLKITDKTPVPSGILSLPELKRQPLSVRSEAAGGWTINGKPYEDGVWIEVEPDLWYRGAAVPDEIPARYVVKREGDKWAWEAQVLTSIGAPHEDTGWQKPGAPKGTAKTLEQAQERALRSLTKDHEFFQRYQERQREKLESAAAKRPPVVLYHYTSEIHLPAILSAGHLRLTDSNIDYSGAGPGVVWLTTTRDPENNGLDGGFGKGAVRFTVEPDHRYLHHWPEWAREQGIEEIWYNALDRAGGGGSENWWVSTEPIPLDRVLTIEVNGVPYRTGAKEEVPEVSGVVLKAADTGRILMLQRSMDDDKAAGTWEWPGGHHEEGDQTSLHAGIREWEEEVGQPFPEGGYVAHTWTSENGVYQGHVVVIPSEKDLVLHEGRVMENPDDPNSECCEQVAWWTVEHAKKNPALREECKGSPWSEIEKAGGTKTAVHKTADEDQCPFDASDSMPTGGGGYVCEDGHYWHPDEPAAQAFHDGPGVIQPLESSQFGQFAEVPALMARRAAEEQVHVHLRRKEHLWTWECAQCGETQPGRGYRDETNTRENAEAHAMWCYDLDWGDQPIVREATLTHGAQGGQQ